MYSQQFTLCCCLVKAFFVFAFKICLPHQLVMPFLSGAPPKKENPRSTPAHVAIAGANTNEQILVSCLLLNTNTLLQIPFRDYCQKLALALTSNPKTALNSLSLNGNAIEDRGMFCNYRIKINHNKTVCPRRDSYSNKKDRSLSCFSTIIFMPLNNKNYKSLSYITNYIVLSTFCDFFFWGR